MYAQCFLISCRRERDNSEAERGQHLKQIHDLQEHLREKESQFIALEEQVFFDKPSLFLSFLVLAFSGYAITTPACS